MKLCISNSAILGSVKSTDIESVKVREDRYYCQGSSTWSRPNRWHCLQLGDPMENNAICLCTTCTNVLTGSPWQAL